MYLIKSYQNNNQLINLFGIPQLKLVKTLI